MRKIREVLRLHSLGLKQRQIARSCSVGQSTVSEYIKAAEAAGLRWPDIADWDEAKLLATLTPAAPLVQTRSRLPAPDFPSIHAELQQHKHLTLQLVWEEYRAQNQEGYRYSRFCELYQRWRRQQEVVLRQEHRAGEKLFVDYAGATISVKDPSSGEIREAQLFVAVLGASNYTFAEATWTQALGDWIGSHIRAFEFFGGVPEIVVPDFVPGNIIGVMWRAALCGPGSRARARSGCSGDMGPHNGSALAHDEFPFGISERRLSCSNVTLLSLQRSIESEEAG
jgi:transposase